MEPSAGMLPFADRRAAGRALATLLVDRAWQRPIVLALPRGGVPVGAEVAAALGADLDVIVARKLGAPGQEELGFGAIAESGVRVVDADARRSLRLSDAVIDELVDTEARELERRVARYRDGRPLPDLADRDVLLVDDGLATGVTAESALVALATRAPRRLVLAVPVAARQSATRLAALADEVVTVAQPRSFGAVGQFYRRFTQTTDAEVLDALRAGRAR